MRLLPLILLAACSDYDIVDQKDPDPPLPEDSEAPVFPDIAVEPLAVNLGVICSPQVVPITLSNQGEGPLTIESLEIAGGSWILGAVSLPMVIEAGGSQTLEVQSGDGAAVLLVGSDDPEEPSISVTLVAHDNVAPTLSFLTPPNGDVLDIGGSTLFTGQVSDDMDPPETLALSWQSDVEGVFNQDPAQPDGSAAALWDPAVRLQGPHNVTFTATDSCGLSSSSTIAVCQDAGYEAESLDLATWYFAGNAFWDATNTWVQLTAPATNQSGTAFQTNSTVTGDNVTIAFRFFASGGSGADGFSITALDANRMTGFVGSSGGGIGYMGLPGWSIEVDTYYNSEYYDPTPEDHTSLHFDGNVSNPVAWSALPDMEDGQWHEMEIEVIAPHVLVSIDGVARIDQNVAGNYSFPAYIGFTAATGALTNYHLIDALTVTEHVCTEQ